MSRILIVDDDAEIAELISSSLQDEGHNTMIAHTGTDGVNILKESEVDIVLLDVMMPGMDGMHTCELMRKRYDGPILFVTAKANEQDLLKGFSAGADDYIVKPFSLDELSARVNAQLRRVKRLAPKNDDRIRVGGITIYTKSMEVEKDGGRIDLTTREFQLLKMLAENSGETLTREAIFQEIWGEKYFDVNTVTVHIKNLRDKVDPENMYIKTVWGRGYTMTAPPERRKKH